MSARQASEAILNNDMLILCGGNEDGYVVRVQAAWTANKDIGSPLGGLEFVSLLAVYPASSRGLHLIVDAR
jgi:hypothetical protein